MIVDIHFKHMDVSETLREHAADKAERLKKYFEGKVHVTWNISKEHDEFVAHCHAVGSHIDLFGEGRAEEAYASVDLALARIEKQLKKHKEIVTDHKTHGED